MGNLKNSIYSSKNRDVQIHVVIVIPNTDDVRKSQRGGGRLFNRNARGDRAAKFDEISCGHLVTRAYGFGFLGRIIIGSLITDKYRFVCFFKYAYNFKTSYTTTPRRRRRRTVTNRLCTLFSNNINVFSFRLIVFTS